MITVSNLTKVYGGKPAVDDLTFEVKPGIVTGFLGPNGAGKSTTMRMITGLDQPTSGTALIDGQKYSSFARPLTKVGTLLDARWTHPKRTAYQHLRYMASSNGIGAARVKECLEIVGLSEVANRQAGKFSLGMGQRLGLAGALLGDPEVLILDEPVNGLDPVGIRWVRDFVRSLAEEGRTVLVSSHLLSEMAQTADHLVVIGKGKLVADTSVHEFVKQKSARTTVVRSEHLDQLKKALGEESVEFTEALDADGRPTLEIPDEDTDFVGALAFTYGLKLAELSERRGSLEDAFMASTNDSVEYVANAPLHGGGTAGGVQPGGVQPGGVQLGGAAGAASAMDEKK